jgi:hypothetical protein
MVEQVNKKRREEDVNEAMPREDEETLSNLTYSTDGVASCDQLVVVIVHERLPVRVELSYLCNAIKHRTCQREVRCYVTRHGTEFPAAFSMG